MLDIRSVDEPPKERVIKELIPKNLQLRADGGTDVNGEWHPNGEYYVHIPKNDFGLKHNYSVDFTPAFNSEGYSTGWHIYVYLCFTSANSKERVVERKTASVKTRKMAVKYLCDFIRDYDSSGQPDEVLREWCRRTARPVFAFVDGDLQLIGVHYGYNPMRDVQIVNRRNKMEQELFLYYNKFLPKYGGAGEAYYLDRDFWPNGKLRIGKMKYSYNSYIGEGIEDSDLLEKMLALVANDGRFAFLLKISADWQ